MPRREKQYNQDYPFTSACISRGRAQSKHSGPLKYTHHTIEATGYGECTVRRIVAKISELVKKHPDYHQSCIKWIGRE